MVHLEISKDTPEREKERVPTSRALTSEIRQNKLTSLTDNMRRDKSELSGQAENIPNSQVTSHVDEWRAIGGRDKRIPRKRRLTIIF